MISLSIDKYIDMCVCVYIYFLSISTLVDSTINYKGGQIFKMQSTYWTTREAIFSFLSSRSNWALK